MMIGVRVPARAEICSEISAPSAPLTDSAIMNALIVHCLWADEFAVKRTGHPPSYAEAEKMSS